MLLLICCVCTSHFCGDSVFVFVWFALLCVLSSNSSKRKRERVAFFYECLGTVYILQLFLTVPRVGLQCVIVVFPDHTYLLFI